MSDRSRNFLIGLAVAGLLSALAVILRVPILGFTSFTSVSGGGFSLLLRTLAAAANWLERDAGHHDRFLLFVDEFDPHEPFDTPEPYASMYDPEWNGPHLIWPPYARGAVATGVLTPAQAHQVRAQYGAKLTMIDAWFGRVLDALDVSGLADSTAVFVLTDHGHYLGEKDIWGKPAAPVYEPLGHIPMFVRWPGIGRASCRERV